MKIIKLSVAQYGVLMVPCQLVALRLPMDLGLLDDEQLTQLSSIAKKLPIDPYRAHVTKMAILAKLDAERERRSGNLAQVKDAIRNAGGAR